jgi:hypothetical protein
VDCPKWATGGECGNNPAYMHKARPPTSNSTVCRASYYGYTCHDSTDHGFTY